MRSRRRRALVVWRAIGAGALTLLIGAAAGTVAPAAEPEAPGNGEHTAAELAAYQAQMAKDQSEHPTLVLGVPAPDFSLPGVDGKVHALSDYKDSPILVVVFISNHCPASQLYEGRLKAIVSDYAAKGVRLVAIAPNGPNAVNPQALNYTDVDDSPDSMRIRSDYRHFNFPYLYDGGSQSASGKYGPKVTPHIFIFDRDRKLRYEGRIDNRIQEGKATTHEARDALDALLAGRAVAVPHAPVFGCSTKWISHTEEAGREMKTWNATPVTLESVSLAELGKLRKNPTGKTLMINFWATWCAPCQIEYPQMLETYLWYRSRDFEFVSVSVNTPEEKAAVQKFLDRTHSAVRNLLVDTDDVYGVMAAFDPTWDSGLPFTMVIAPDSSVIYRRQGEVDLLALRRTILANLPDAGMFAGNAAYWRQ